jgi:hypothetical protein
LKLPPKRPFAPASPLKKDAKKILEPRTLGIEREARPRPGVVVSPAHGKSPAIVVPTAQEVAIVSSASTPRDRIIAEASLLSPGLYGLLLWVEARCVAAGMHAMDPQWLEHFEQFYRSGKMIDVGRFGLRAGKSVSVPRALVAETWLVSRRLELGQVGVCSVMAQNMREAADRFSTARQILHAIGLPDNTGHRTEDDDGFTCAGGGSTALKITMKDLEGHSVEIRVYPASIPGAAGFTGIAGFCDETDLWGKDEAANPAKRVIEILVTRYTTQPQAKLHIMSATYFPKSAHAEMVAAGDTPLQYVARLGMRGAEKDAKMRAEFAAEIKSTDPLLLAPSDPQSTDIPSWVSNPITPIGECYKKAAGDLRRMFALYGARVAMTGGAKMSADDYLWLAAAMTSPPDRSVTLDGGSETRATEYERISRTGAGRNLSGIGGGGGPCL